MAVVTACVGALAVQESPLTAVQMLWVNLIMDSLASLALATDSPTEGMLDLPPYSAQQSLLTPTVSWCLSCTLWVGPHWSCRYIHSAESVESVIWVMPVSQCFGSCMAHRWCFTDMRPTPLSTACCPPIGGNTLGHW